MCDYPNREAAMVVLRRDETGRATVWCDPCIANVVDALNLAGLTTMASCCGHGRRPASIALTDGRWVLLMGGDDFDRVAPLWPDINAPLTPRED